MESNFSTLAKHLSMSGIFYQLFFIIRQWNKKFSIRGSKRFSCWKSFTFETLLKDLENFVFRFMGQW